MGSEDQFIIETPSFIKLKDEIQLSIAFKDIVKPKKCILMHGPSGTGKSIILKQIAEHFNLHYMRINACELFSRWVGESEKQTRQIFSDLVEKSPSMLIIDECQHLFSPPKQDDNSKGNVHSILLEEVDIHYITK